MKRSRPKSADNEPSAARVRTQRLPVRSVQSESKSANEVSYAERHDARFSPPPLVVASSRRPLSSPLKVCPFPLASPTEKFLRAAASSATEPASRNLPRSRASLIFHGTCAKSRELQFAKTRLACATAMRECASRK